MTRLTIGLLWHSVNSDNLGVGALTVSNISIIEEICETLGIEPFFLVFGAIDTSPIYISGDNIEAVALRTRSFVPPSKYHSAVRKCDLVIDISAGDSFADIYGAKRIGRNFLGKLAVLMARKPLLFGPQTIGPFNSAWAKTVSNFMMKRAKLVATRDALSTDYIAQLKLGDKAIEATDVAMRLPYDKNKYLKAGGPRVGLNVSGLLFNGGYTGKNMFDLKADYPMVVRRIVGALLEEDSKPEIHFVGHVNSEIMSLEDDFRVADTLSKEFPGTVLAPRFASPSDAKSYISSLDFFAGARMHACIAAFSSGVPVVPMAYSRKFEGLFGTLGYHRTTDCRTETQDNIVEAVVGGYRDRDVLASETRESFAKAETRLKVYADRLRSSILEVAGQ